MRYDITVRKSLLRPAATVLGVLGIFLLSLGLFPFMGLSFFPRTDPGQFVINVKAPSGTRIELTDKYIARVEEDIRATVPASDLGMIVSNIGITPDFSAIYTSNSGQHTAFVQVSLKEGHKRSSFAYMNLVRSKLQERSSGAYPPISRPAASSMLLSIWAFRRRSIFRLEETTWKRPTRPQQSSRTV